ncbi:MAG TPA: TonB family protein [Nitrospirota bacterium]|nr:TonB family protein [Nitrospirota bacterium]
MKLYSGKRIGQSGGELAAAAVFSFILHVIFFAATLLYLHANPKKYTPPFYDVKLVGQPTEAPALPKATLVASQPAPPKQEAKAAPKAKKAAPKTFKAQAKKGDMPELAKPLQKPVPAEPVKPEEPLKEQPTAPVAKTPGGTAGPVAKGETVEVKTPQQDFRFAWYLAVVRDKIGQNWRPPPDAKDAKARVTFSINRSGWVGDANLDTEHSSGTFGFKQAAIRAIRSSNPFPPLPEEFSKQTLEFSVDLTTE